MAGARIFTRARRPSGDRSPSAERRIRKRSRAIRNSEPASTSADCNDSELFRRQAGHARQAVIHAFVRAVASHPGPSLPSSGYAILAFGVGTPADSRDSLPSFSASELRDDGGEAGREPRARPSVIWHECGHFAAPLSQPCTELNRQCVPIRLDRRTRQVPHCAETRSMRKVRASSRSAGQLARGEPGAARATGRKAISRKYPSRAQSPGARQ